MNKTQLADAIAKSAGLNHTQAAAALDAFINTVQGEVKKGQKVTIPGFGTFARTRRKARTGRNPRTGTAIKIAASNAPTFKAGATFKGIVSGKAPAKKAAPKKAAPKKAAAKKAAPKKAAAKKAAPKKAAAKKAAPKKAAKKR
ncbi:MAG: HU family DNA-binding protein [Acidimicrobiia bacterium]